MKKNSFRNSIIAISIMSVLLTNAVVISAESDDTVIYNAIPSVESSEANNWLLDTNIAVETTEGTGFKINSINRQAVGALVKWGFSYGQLKTTPYFNITINNSEKQSKTPYFRLFFLAGNAMVEPEPFVSSLENWIKASTMQGSYSINILEAINNGGAGELSDESMLYMVLYIDQSFLDTTLPAEPLEIGELYLSSVEIETPDISPSPEPTISIAPTATVSQSVPESTEDIQKEKSIDPIIIVIASLTILIVIVAIYFAKHRTRKN